MNEIEVNIITRPASNYIFDNRGLGRMYYDNMLNNEDRVALIDGLTGRKIIYKQVLKRAIRISIALEKNGVSPGDVIAIYSYNHLDTTSILTGALFRNILVVCMDETSSPELVVTILQETKPKVIFVVEDTFETSIQAIENLSLNTKVVLMDCCKTSYTALSEYLQPSIEEKTFEPLNVKSLYQTAVIFYTSGTTEKPKGVCRCHLSLLYPLYNLMNYNFGTDVILEFNSPAWSVHLNHLSLAVFRGSARVIYTKFLPEYAWQFPKHKVTCMFLSIWEAVCLSQRKPFDKLDLSHLRLITISGGVLSAQKMLQVNRTFPGVEIYNIYGQTEVGVIFVSDPQADDKFPPRKSECVGKGLSGISYKVVDLTDGQLLGPYKKGELRFKAVYPLGRYYNKNSSSMYDEDGWYKSGDLAYYDYDGHFYIVDRVKETFKFQDYVIIPSLIEDVLLRHPAVSMAMVTIILDDHHMEQAVGVVTLKERFKNTTSNEIVQFVAERVMDYEQLRGGVKIIGEFLLTSSGKINRQFIRDSITNGMIR